MADTFTFVPDLTSKRRQTPRIKRIKFGNGYSQKYGDGINSNLSTWDMTFTANSDAEKEYIDEFFADHYLTYFHFEHPEVSGLIKPYECTSWEVEPLGAGNYTVTAVFEEWPGLYAPITQPEPGTIFTDTDLFTDYGLFTE